MRRIPTKAALFNSMSKFHALIHQVARSYGTGDSRMRARWWEAVLSAHAGANAKHATTSLQVGQQVVIQIDVSLKEPVVDVVGYGLDRQRRLLRAEPSSAAPCSRRADKINHRLLASRGILHCCIL